MKRLKYLSTLLVAAVALIAAWLLWNFYTQSPWTRDGKVRAEQGEAFLSALDAADRAQLRRILQVLDRQPD